MIDRPPLPIADETYAADGSHLTSHEALWEPLSNRTALDLGNLTLMEVQAEHLLEFQFLDRPVRVDLARRRLLQPVQGGWAPWEDSLLTLVTLTYLGRVQRLVPMGREIIGVRDLREGHFFVGPHAFQLERLVARFGVDPAALRPAAARLGGTDAALADAAVRLQPFPRIPLYYLLWVGDGEFPPRIEVLFDRSIEAYLPADAIWALVNRVGQALAAA
jgi:hypothetical protein